MRLCAKYFGLVNANYFRNSSEFIMDFPAVVNGFVFYRDLSDNHLEELPSDLLANLSILQELCVKPYFSLNFIKLVVNVSSAIQETGKIG